MLATSILLVCAGSAAQDRLAPAELGLATPLAAEISSGAPVIDTATLRTNYSRKNAVVGTTFRMRIPELGTYTVELVSYAFDAYLVLRTPNGAVVAEDDDGAADTHARLVFEAQELEYLVDVCALHGRRGPFRLTLQRGRPVPRTPAEEMQSELEDARERLRVTAEAEGEDSLAVAKVLEQMAPILWHVQRPDESFEVLQRALRIQEQRLGVGHLHTAVTLNDIASLLRNEGLFGEAVKYAERVLEISERHDDPEHTRVATALNNLALPLVELGECDRARELLERALALREAHLVAEPEELAAVLSSLGVTLLKLGNPLEARPLLERALELRLEVDGPDSASTIVAMENLAGGLRMLREYELAIELGRRTLAFRENTYGPDHPWTALSSNNLGVCLLMVGEIEEARALIERSLAIRKQCMPPGHPTIATALACASSVRQRMGDHAGALSSRREALAICEAAFGPLDSRTVDDQAWIACAIAGSAQLAEAHTLIENCLKASAAIFEDSRWSLSEWERLDVAARAREQVATLLGIARLLGNEEAQREAYERVIEWKGRIARGLFEDKRRLLAALDGEGKALLSELTAVQASLSATLFQREIGERAVYDARLAELRRKRSALERALVSRARDSDAHRTVTVAELARSLPPGSALVDFFVHPGLEPAEMREETLVTAGRLGPERVTAWILRPEHPHPVRVDLGEAEPLREEIAGFLAAMKVDRGAAVADAGPDPLAERNSALRRALWAPLAPHLEGAALLLVSPDRFLGTLPLETLALEDGTYLLESRAFAYLPDAASLARMAALPKVAGVAGGILAVGGVDYEDRSAAPAEDAASTAAASRQRGSLQTYWEPLRFTRREAQMVVDTYRSAMPEAPVQLLERGLASEKTIKREMPGKRFIHVASHGFFQPSGSPSMWEEVRASAGIELRMFGEVQRVTGLMPGLLSGLVTAGANRSRAEGEDDGLLTAEEVTWLDLNGCELVVLSACETALGTERGGEGLMSLQQAFRMAGAKTVVSSLWNVDDEATGDLMRAFYRRLWIDEVSRIEALRGAQLERLRQNRIEHRGRALPWSWGGFVLFGDWR